MADIELLGIDIQSRQFHSRPMFIDSLDQTAQTATGIQHELTMIKPLEIRWQRLMAATLFPLTRSA